MIDLKNIIFEDDPVAIGKWEFWDKIDNLNQFDNEYCKGNECSYDFKKVYFLPKGQGYWIFEAWTKGKLYIHYGGDDPILCYPYQIKQTANGDFMFIFVDDEDGKFIYVLKKSSKKHYSLQDVKKVEDVNLPFVDDKQIIGKWKSVAYIENIDDFENETYDKSIRMWLESAEFFEGGKAQRKYFNDTSWDDRWTKGKLLDLTKSVVSKYIIKTINDKEYLFLEWKMGNYIYGGMPPTFYVFERA